MSNIFAHFLNNVKVMITVTDVWFFSEWTRNCILNCKKTDQLSRDWWQQRPHQNCLWPLPPPTVNKRNALMNTLNRKITYINYNNNSMCVKTCFQIHKMLSSTVACTFSKEVGCIGAGFWVNEETECGPEEVGTLSEFPGLSVLCSASVKRKKKGKKKTVVNNRVKLTMFSNHI